ncbi:MAG: branched-chain amino acid transport system ATP-binding protein [Epulopiscium sp.]|nr:branched-chain amino acid transport system ATP-binding protein [Candidatus Epulonipiscium sp.]
MLFKCENICKHFGGVKVANNLSLKINRGEIVGIMGPNGAGKTTLINMISGLEKVDSGDIYLDGEKITNLEPHVISRKGIMRSFQTTSNFAEESIEENIGAALICDKANCRKTIQEKTNKILEEVQMSHLAKKKVCEVPIASSKFVELCRCLISNPKLVLLDELYAGLTWEESKLVTKLLKEKKEKEGVSFILIEHRTEILFDAVDRIVVLNQGANYFEGLPAEIATNESVAKLYWGK